MKNRAACDAAVTLESTRKLTIASIFLTCAMAVLGCAASRPSAPAPTPPTSANAGNTTIVAIAPAKGTGMSLPEFLGINKLGSGIGGVFQRIGSRIVNGLDLQGRFPGLQPTPPLLSITDPSNLGADQPPAVQAAAEVKQEEDQAPQKVMAIRYLATLGCGGCYEKVEDALLEAMSDCTEEVRYEAVKALQCRPDCGCRYCSSPSCCSAKIRKRLEELTQCEKEPSARIRRMARLALACCNTKPLTDEEEPREGPPADQKESLPTTAASDYRPKNRFEDIHLVSFQQSTQEHLGDMLLAEVNGEPIFESQLTPLINAKLEKLGTSLSSGAVVNRNLILQNELRRVIEWKLLEQSARQEVRLASATTSTQVSPSEVELWFDKSLPLDQFVSATEISSYYEINLPRYQSPSRVRWEKVSISIDQSGSLDAATRIATFLTHKANGTQVTPPVEMNADCVETEIFGWTDLGEDMPARLAIPLSQLPIGAVSQVIQESRYLVLIRVLERRDAEKQPLSTVAESIRQEILQQRRETAEAKLIAQLRGRSRIWTVFDARGNNSFSTTTNSR